MTKTDEPKEQNNNTNDIEQSYSNHGSGVEIEMNPEEGYSRISSE